MSLIYSFKYSPIDTWKALWNTAINPTEPTFYGAQTNPDGSMGLTVSGPAVSGATGSGALLQGVLSQLPAVPFTTLTTNLSVMVDNSPARQWVEIDTRLTTADGFTYPGDLHIGVDGSIGIGDMSGNWHPIALKIPPLSPWFQYPIAILKSYDFTAKTSTVISLKVGATVYAINQTFPAVNVAWSPNDAIVEQHQVDQSASGGTCTVIFSQTTISGS